MTEKAPTISALISKGEGPKVEFKTASNGVYDDTFETICSFANHRGGDIILGVNDHGLVVGVPRKSTADVVSKIINSCQDRNLFSASPEISVETVEENRRLVIHIHVKHTKPKIQYRGVAYKRIGESDFKEKAKSLNRRKTASNSAKGE